jgi:hypothetical protein
MKARIILPIFVALWLSGCASTWDLSAKYQSVVGKQFRTIDEGWIWEMTRHEYDLVPYTLQSAKADLGRAGRRIAFVPAGTVLTVKEAKRRYSGGDWDILIAEIELPATGKKYLFEELLGFSSATPADVDKHWLPVKKEPNSEHSAAP